ncbi:Uncharacterized conserved protein (DUF2215 [Striga hermonthica]|uniref:Uncharacterized conserved protein (DUF2215) n=1 Tax=Striga hermonthica TaxID=68872 RepID=A0A9N7RRJ1_STRHE|nr:Uncharacterized conserved protein (DUF2215 [Striga hermonthica]
MSSTATAALVLWFLLLSSSLTLSIDATSNFSLVISETMKLHISPSLIVENSPGLKPGAKVKCERVPVHGLPRIKHLRKFANSLKVKVSCTNPSAPSPRIDVCFHRNASLGVGMCPQDHWERLSKGLWMKPMSPFDHKILDIRVGTSYSESLEVSFDEEFFLYRILFLVFGIVLMSLAPWLSQSLVFYYSGAMVIGIFLVILMILFQGMKLLPTGRKSSLGIFLYSCFIGLGSFLLQYVPKLLRALMAEIGLPEDMHDSLAILLLVFLVITGACLGFWVVRKLVLTADGSIDFGVSQFVTWSLRIVASVMILQSSLDPLLAVGAWVGGIVISLLLMSPRPKVVRRVCRKLRRLKRLNLKEPLDPYASPVTNPSIPRPPARSPYTSVPGSRSKSPERFSDSQTFYSTFHDTPDRRKFAKAEWKSFTRESTRKALEGLVSSPDFSKWAVAHADRITLAPTNESSAQHRRWFHWF